MTQEAILGVLQEVVHPEFKQNIVALGMVEGLTLANEEVRFSLALPKVRDPFAASLKRSCEGLLVENFPALKGHITIFIKEAAPHKPIEKKERSSTEEIRQIIAIASGKGGVGKSTVTANLAVALQRIGFRVGIIDADIYGPSIPKMFGVEKFVPEAIKRGDKEVILPAEKYGIKLMSIGFFIKPEDALIWRGPMATSALRQLIHDTDWGALDFLLIDLPPGTGDVHLTIINELKVNGAVIVSTPQEVALADVVRGISMFQAENIAIPILGLIENMAWFTPKELPHKKYYIFGKEGCRKMAKKRDIPLLGEIPLVEAVCEGGDQGTPIAKGKSPVAEAFNAAAQQLADATHTTPRT